MSSENPREASSESPSRYRICKCGALVDKGEDILCGNCLTPNYKDFPLMHVLVNRVQDNHNAYLWDRALDPATVEAVASGMYMSGLDEGDPGWEDAKRMAASLLVYWEEYAKAGITTLMTALLGPRPESEN